MRKNIGPFSIEVVAHPRIVVSFDAMLSLSRVFHGVSYSYECCFWERYVVTDLGLFAVVQMDLVFGNWFTIYWYFLIVYDCLICSFH